MTFPDELTLAGVIVTAVGSSLGMLGIFFQTNGYYAFKSFQVFENIYRVARTLTREGTAAARRHIDATASVAEAKGEDRGKSLLGLYCVLFGFFLQLVGSLILIAALFANQKP